LGYVVKFYRSCGRYVTEMNARSTVQWCSESPDCSKNSVQRCSESPNWSRSSVQTCPESPICREIVRRTLNPQVPWLCLLKCHCLLVYSVHSNERMNEWITSLRIRIWIPTIFCVTCMRYNKPWSSSVHLRILNGKRYILHRNFCVISLLSFEQRLVKWC